MIEFGYFFIQEGSGLEEVQKYTNTLEHTGKTTGETINKIDIGHDDLK
jgi:hypothetical protein